MELCGSKEQRQNWRPEGGDRWEGWWICVITKYSCPGSVHQPGAYVVDTAPQPATWPHNPPGSGQQWNQGWRKLHYLDWTSSKDHYWHSLMTWWCFQVLLLQGDHPDVSGKFTHWRQRWSLWPVQLLRAINRSVGLIQPGPCWCLKPLQMSAAWLLPEAILMLVDVGELALPSQTTTKLFSVIGF